MNTWPGEKRRATSQMEHEKWNAVHYPGTLQICCKCDEPTTFCEEDGYFDDEGCPYCFKCATKHELAG